VTRVSTAQCETNVTYRVRERKGKKGEKLLRFNVQLKSHLLRLYEHLAKTLNSWDHPCWTIPYSANTRSAKGLEASKRKAELDLYAYRRLELTKGFELSTKGIFSVHASRLTTLRNWQQTIHMYNWQQLTVLQISTSSHSQVFHGELKIEVRIPDYTIHDKDSCWRFRLSHMIDQQSSASVRTDFCSVARSSKSAV